MRERAMRILCATDLGTRSEAAMDRAGELADATGARLTLLHVVVPGSGRVLEQTLREAQATLGARAEPPLWRARRLPHTALRTGNPARVIVDELRADGGTDLLVLGPHRRRPLRDVLEDTIAARALSLPDPVAVLIVQEPVRAPYRRVMLALDASAASVGALRAAEALVLRDAARAVVVHAYEPPYVGLLDYAGVRGRETAAYANGWCDEATRAIDHLLRRESEDPGRYGMLIEERQPAPGILHAVSQFGPDLLVMGTRGGGRIHRALLGSVANRVLRDVTCDVLVVPEAAAPAARVSSPEWARAALAR